MSVPQLINSCFVMLLDRRLLTMTVYSLVFSESGEIVDGNDYLDLDQAYDVAEMYSAEQRCGVAILERQGNCEYQIAFVRNF